MSRLIKTPQEDILIHPAVPGDAPLLRELRLEALANHPVAFSADYAASAAESVRQWSERVVSYVSEDVGMISVAATHDRLVGMAGFHREKRPKTRHSGTIWGVYVKTEWRGLHVAEALLEECAAWARARGVVILKLGVITTNTPAICCYARCGFRVYGIDPQAVYYDGVFYDELLMAKSI